MRTKEEITNILAKRKFPEALNASTWGDLVSAISSYSLEEKTVLVNLIVSGNSKKVGERLKQALYNNARERALTETMTMLVDDSLNLEELDSLL